MSTMQGIEKWQSVLSQLFASGDTQARTDPADPHHVDALLIELDKEITKNGLVVDKITEELTNLILASPKHPNVGPALLWSSAQYDVFTAERLDKYIEAIYPAFTLEFKAIFMFFISSKSSCSPEKATDFLLGVALGDKSSSVTEEDIPDKLRALALFGMLRVRIIHKTRPKIEHFLAPLLTTSIGSRLASRKFTLGPCLKFAATYVITQIFSEVQDGAILESLMDVFEHFETGLISAWATEIPSIIGQWCTFSGRNISEFLRTPAPSVAALMISIAGKLVSNARLRIEENVKSRLISLGEKKIPGSALLLAHLVIPAKIPSEMFFEEHIPLVQEAILAIASNPDAFQNVDVQNQLITNQLPTTQEALLRYINTPLPEHLKNTQRIPVLDGLDDIDWSKLEHAYGDAADIPRKIRAIAGQNAELRKNTFSSLAIGPYHHGQVYSCTAPLATWLLKLLAFPLQQDKDKIVHWLTLVAACCPENYSYEFFSENERLPADDHPDFVHNPRAPGAIRDTYRAVAAGVDILMKLVLEILENPNPQGADAALFSQLCWCLSFFPSRKDDILEFALSSVSKLNRENHSTQSAPTKLPALLMLISSLVTSPTDEKASKCLSLLESTWKNEEEVSFTRLIAAFAHARILQHSIDPLPVALRKYLTHQNIRNDAFQAIPEDRWPWGRELVCLVVQKRLHEFVDDMILAFSETTDPNEAEKIACILLRSSFPDPGGSRWTYEPLWDWYDFRTAFWSQDQIRVLKEIAAKSECWTNACEKDVLEPVVLNQGRAEVKACTSELQRELKLFLETDTAVTRSQLSLSLQKLAELPSFSKEDIESDDLDTDPYARGRML